MIRCGKYSIKKLIQHLSLIMFSWDVFKDNVKEAKILLTITEPCLNREFPRVELKKLPYFENFRISSWYYDMEGHAKKCVERYCELTNKTTQKLYKVSTTCIDDHHFKEEKRNPWEKCQQDAFKLFCNAETWHVLEDLIFMVNEQNLHVRSRNGPKLVTND